MTEKTKAIIVADDQIHAFFTEQYADWDTQTPVNTIEQLWADLGSGILSDASKVVVISDKFYDPRSSSESFIGALATLAPEALVAVLFDYGNETHASVITERVSRMLDTDNAHANIYFISASDPLTDLDNALIEYARVANGENMEGFENDDEYVDDHTVVGENVKVTGTVGTVDISHNGTVVTSTSSKGGSGKSSCALMLAAQISQSSKKAAAMGLVDEALKVCVVDLDVRDGQIGFLIGQTSPTALNVRLAPDYGPQTIANNLVYDDRMGIWALLAPKHGRTADDTGPEFYQEVIRNLRAMFDVVVLDTSVNYLDPLVSEVCLPESDAVLFVTNLGVGSVFGMSRWFTEVTADIAEGGAGISMTKIGIVVNQSLPNVGMDKNKIIQAAMGAPLVAAIPLETAAFITASNKNRIGDMLLHHTVGPAYFRLAKKVIGARSPLVELVSEDSGVAPRSNQQGLSSGSKKRDIPAVRASEKKSRRLFGR